MKPAEHGTVLITGASSGIGMEFARQLAEKGFDLAVTARSTAALEKLKTTLEAEHGVKITVITSDLSKPGAAQELQHHCRINGVTVDYLINNAGSGLYGEHLEQNPAEAMTMLTLNISALTELCMLFGAEMKQRGRGRILNVSSMVGLFPTPLFTAYAASKSYVYNYSLALRSELKKFGIKVTCLLPGFVNTNFDKAAQVKESAFQRVAHASGMTPGLVARIGIKAMLRGRAQVVPGLLNSIGAFFIGFIPKAFMSDVTAVVMRKLNR